MTVPWGYSRRGYWGIYSLPGKMPLKNTYDILEGGTFFCGHLAIFATLPEGLHTADRLCHYTILLCHWVTSFFGQLYETFKTSYWFFSVKIAIWHFGIYRSSWSQIFLWDIYKRKNHSLAEGEKLEWLILFRNMVFYNFSQVTDFMDGSEIERKWVRTFLNKQLMVSFLTVSFFSYNRKHKNLNVWKIQFEVFYFYHS